MMKCNKRSSVVSSNSPCQLSLDATYRDCHKRPTYASLKAILNITVLIIILPIVHKRHNIKFITDKHANPRKCSVRVWNMICVFLERILKNKIRLRYGLTFTYVNYPNESSSNLFNIRRPCCAYFWSNLF